MSASHESEFAVWADEADVNGLPQVVLPGAGVTISDCAKELFGLIAPTRSLFMRAGVPVRLIRRADGMLALEVLLPVAARSYFEQFGRLFAWRTGRNGEPVLKPVSCPLDMADALLHADATNDLLPSVRGLVNCPVLREIHGELQVAGPGYDEETGLIVTGGVTPAIVPVDCANDQFMRRK